jgi:structure-specific recognition protein 1
MAKKSEQKSNAKAEKTKDIKTSGKGKSRGVKKEKDPNAPKRGKSAYLFFCEAKRAESKSKSENITLQQLSELWKSIDESEKKVKKFIC